ncbi:hypothetical protein Tco_0103442 [Tanacetum coccineum]
MMGLVIRDGSGNNNDGTPPFSKEQTEGCLSAPNAALHEARTGGSGVGQEKDVETRRGLNSLQVKALLVKEKVVREEGYDFASKDLEWLFGVFVSTAVAGADRDMDAEKEETGRIS